MFLIIWQSWRAFVPFIDYIFVGLLYASASKVSRGCIIRVVTLLQIGDDLKSLTGNAAIARDSFFLSALTLRWSNNSKCALRSKARFAYVKNNWRIRRILLRPWKRRPMRSKNNFSKSKMRSVATNGSSTIVTEVRPSLLRCKAIGYGEEPLRMGGWGENAWFKQFACVSLKLWQLCIIISLIA